MTITLTPDIETAIIQQAGEHRTSPEELVLGVLRERFRPGMPEATFDLEPRDEWEAELLSLGTDCGVSLSNEALSSEELYD